MHTSLPGSPSRPHKHESARLNRGLLVLLAGHRVLAGSGTEQELAQRLCQALGEASGMRLAWWSPAAHCASPQLMASWGLDAPALTDLRWPDPADDLPCLWTASPAAAADSAWQTLARRLGFAAALQLPVTSDDQLLGTLCVLAAEPDAFDADMLEALQQSARNLALAYERARAEQARRCAVAALQASNAKLQAALDNLHDPLLIADAQGHHIHLNEACVAFHRASSKDECVRAFADCQSHFAMLQEGRAVPHAQWPVSRALRGERGSEVEFQVQRLDSGERWIGSYSFAPIPGPDGAIAGAVVSARDLSEQRAREAELNKAHDRLRLALNAAGAGYWDWVIETDSLTWSPEIYQLLGLDPQTTVAGVAAWESAVHPEDRELVRQQLGQVMRERTPLLVEYRVLLPGDRVRWILATGSATADDSGRLRSMTGLCADVTLRKQNDQELRNHRDHLEELVTQRTAALLEAKEGAEAATRAKSAFLANMSHEIRTPMNAIVGLTHLCLRDSGDATLSDRLGKIDVAAKHLQQILNDVLDLSTVGAGKLALEHIEFPRDELLGRVMSMVGGEARRKGLELILDTDHLPRTLCGDPKQLAQALTHLMSNAVKFTDAGWVRLSCSKLAEDAARLQLRFEVQDTGIGIPAHQLGRLFDAFEQADTSTTRRHGGSGLGLTLTRQLVQLMDGEVGVRSEVGSGSCFWFSVWLDKVQPPSLPPQALQGLRVLLADDLPQSLQALVDSLQVLQVEVDALGSGPAALHRAQEAAKAGRGFDALLLDATMSPLDGVETLVAMRRLLADATPPAILVVNDEAGPLWQKARDAGFASVLAKPVTPSALQDALAGLLQRKRSAALRAGSADGRRDFERLRRHAGQRVLLAEDNPVNQEVAGELLTAAGLVVELAAHGAAALRMAGERSYALVLMDVQMPGMDGLDATRAIRARGLAQLPIVAMTANVSAQERAACLAAGMNDHLAKPVDPAALYRMLLRWLPPLAPQAPPTASSADGQAAPTLLQRLADVDGFDLERALRNLGGQASIVERVLRSFVRSYAQRSAPDLLAAAAPDPVPRWREQCHSIRGACATIGASDLEAELRRFEQDLAKPAELPALSHTAQQLQTRLHGLAAGLEAALQ
jgi:PAS domain S-box-containing protein